MLPYSVIQEAPGPQRQKPKPLVWHSRHYLELHGVEIMQPKLRVVLQGQQTHRPTDKHISDIRQSVGDLPPPHIIDSNRNPVKGFRVGQPRPEPNTHMSPVNSSVVPESGVRREEVEQERREEEGEQEEEVREYEVRVEGEQETVPLDDKNSYTRQLVSIIDNKKEQNFREQKKSSLQLPEVQLGEQEEFEDDWKEKKLRRELGVLAREKQYTYEVLISEEDQRLLLEREEAFRKPPRLDHPQSQELLKSLEPAKEEEIQRYALERSKQRELEKRDSRISRSSVSRSSRRHKIFDQSRFRGNEVESEYMQVSAKREQNVNFRIEESQIRSYHPNPQEGEAEVAIVYHNYEGNNEELVIQDHPSYIGSGEASHREIYEEEDEFDYSRESEGREAP